MSESVKPAMTEEEWKQWLAGTPLSEEELGPGFTHHSNAATSLYGQSFGFTREDVELLRNPHAGECSMWWLSDYSGAQMCNCGDDERLAALADRIEALLPPEKK